MTQTTNIRGDWNINSIAPTDKINFNTSQVTINGNLIITGNSATVESTNTAITDAVIVLNQGEVGAGVSFTYEINGNTTVGQASGVQIDRGTYPNVAIVYNDSVQHWQLTNDGYTFGNIVVSAGAGANPGVTLPGNLDLFGSAIVDTLTNLLRLENNVALAYTTVVPLPTAGYTTIYANIPGAGGSGLFTTSNTATGNISQELINKNRSIVYSVLL